MSCILSIQTATPVLSVALHQEGKVITSMEHHVAQSHSSVLIDVIDTILKLNHKSLQDLAAIAISAGPGSYTGLRVGLSMAKGLCLGAGLPLIAVDTLSPMIEAAQAYPVEGMYGVLLDARRGNAYGLITDACGQVVDPIKKYKVEVATFEPWLNKLPIYFVGSGAENYQALLKTHANSHFIQNISPKASYMGRLAYAKFLKKDFVDQPTFEPWY